MEIKVIKCSSKEDENTDAISYCGECKIYMCNKCEKFHSKLFYKHQVYNLNQQKGEIFTGFCKETNHPNKLEFFCKDHYILCCVACLCKIKKEGIGFHRDCNVCLIEDIKEEKKIKNESNVKYLEKIIDSLNNSIDNLKKMFEKIIKNKEELKLNIQKIFTKIRNELNNREDELLLEVDKKFSDINFDENFLKQCEKLPNKVKLSLEKSKKIQFNDDNLASSINECIIIENNIKEIKPINETIKKCQNENNIEIQFQCNEQLNPILEIIKQFGNIYKINKNIIFDSIISKNRDKNESIINWIKEKTNKDEIKFEKIFTMSINGNSSKDFHKYCDNQGPNLILVKTKKNKIFGGFTPLSWENKGKDKYDKKNQTFIFSLNFMKKYDMIDTKIGAIYCSEGNGPYFGGYTSRDFSIGSNMKKGETYANEYSNFLPNDNLDLTGSKGERESFDIEDFEVFKVIY